MIGYSEIDIVITPDAVTLKGESITPPSSGRGVLMDLYNTYIGGYPKFFKMDTLSQLGFVGAEILFQKHPLEQKEDCIIVFGNTCSSIKNDTDYLKTIESPDNYYPSPSIFVYTLPNIVTGEIAIRHKIYGETCFYVLENEDQLFELATNQLKIDNVQSALVGWVECKEKNKFYANIKLLWKN